MDNMETGDNTNIEFAKSLKYLNEYSQIII